MLSLLAEDNLCGKSLLALVARGNSIIAELFRLAQNLPPYISYVTEGASSALDLDQQKYAKILFSFAYFKDPEEHERLINQNSDLTDIDVEFQDNNQALLERCFLLFESMVKYLDDLKTFTADVDRGFYIQHTISNILLDTDGKQLLTEAVYLFGVMLLMMETYLPGPVRERIVVAYYRRSGQTVDVDDIIKLTRATGYIPGVTTLKNRPKKYPEQFFARFQLPSEVIRLIIGRLQSDDVYHAMVAFPNPDHRSTALANQAAMLYVILYFSPKTLNDEMATMREIVDKHFNDNWIITIYMGHIIDLSVEWLPYKAAKTALDNVLQPGYIVQLNQRNIKQLGEAMHELQEYLVEGVLVDQFVIDNVNPLLDCIRKCNVVLRWRMLHRRTGHKKFQEVILGSGVNADQIMSLFLLSAQLEWKLKRLYEGLLDGKGRSCEECKQQSVQRLTELSDFFSGEKALTRIARDENLMKWFAATAQDISELDYDEDHATVTGRKIKGYIKALEEVEQFEELDTNLQIKAYLQETRDFLYQIVRIINLKHTDLNIMDTVSDTSYAWRVMSDYIENIHQRVKADPSTVVLLRAALLKLSSILEVPLMRINQCNSPDTISVAEYYSSGMVDLLREVLEIIPKSVFKNLTEIVQIQTHRIKPVPIKVEAIYLKDYAQLDERYLMAKLTHRVSIFTEGILAMEKTLLGVIQVDPRQILEDGLRKELVRQISEAMHETLVFKEATTNGDRIALEVEKVMNALAIRMNAFRRSVEYVQDYIDLAGLRIWQEELSRVVYYNIEQESNRFLKKKVYDHQSKYQSRAIPIPRFAPLDSDATTFMGRVLMAVLKMTDPKTTVYVPECAGWYNQSDGTELCGIGTFSLLNRAIGVIGLGGLDRLLAFNLVHELGKFIGFYKRHLKEYFPFLEELQHKLFPAWSCPENAAKVYATGKVQLEKVLQPILVLVCKIGQAQLLRKQILNELLFGCRMDANLYHESLSTLNKSMLHDIRQYYRKPESANASFLSEKNPLLGEVTVLLEKCGMDDPLARIYVTTDPLEGLSMLLLMFILTNLPKLDYDENFGTLIRKKSTFPLDGYVLVVGISTILKQFHPSYTSQLLKMIGQYIRISVDAVYKANNGRFNYQDSELPEDVLHLIFFTRELCSCMNIPKEAVPQILPRHVIRSVKTN